MKKEEVILRKLTITEITLVAYLTFINEKKLLTEAEKYVDGFVRALNEKDLEELYAKNKKVFEEMKDDVTKSA